MKIKELLAISIDKKASDLHLSAGLPPLLRIDGDLEPLQTSAIEAPELILLLQEIMNSSQQKEFAENLEIDFAITIPDLGRFRVNAFHQARGPAAVLRIIPSTIPTLDALRLPVIIKKIADLPRGLVLVTGPTGAGKNTTLAAIIDYINDHQTKHVITIEDPIEFIHKSKKCLIHQREVHCNTHTFSAALRSALREDPNIILIGELRDLETIRLALTAAETGHLVLATLHTSSAAKTINRIVDSFPTDEKNIVRAQLSESLQAILCQTLIKKIGGGRTAAMEILIATPAIRNLIREDKVAQIYSMMQTGANVGMCTLDQHLQELVKQKLIEPITAYNLAVEKNKFEPIQNFC